MITRSLKSLSALNTRYSGIEYQIKDEHEGLTSVDLLTQSAAYFHAMNNQKVAVAVSDTKEYRIYIPGNNIDHKLKAGNSIGSDTILYHAITKGERVSRAFDKSTYGISYIGTAIPIFDDNGKSVIGGITFCEPLEEIENLSSSANYITQVSNELLNIVATLATSNNMILDKKNIMQATSKNSYEKIITTNNIVDFIKNISTNAGLLGLNASIEAAKAGEVGKGFTIVAQEIRKLSNETKNNASMITSILKDVYQSSEELIHEIDDIGSHIESHNDFLKDLSSITEKLQVTSDKLKSISENLISRE